MNDLIAPLVRRAVLDLLAEIGGEHNHDVLTVHLNARGHRLARSHVEDVLNWLCEGGLVKAEAVGPYVVASITSDGRDVADGRLTVTGISPHKTGA